MGVLKVCSLLWVCQTMVLEPYITVLVGRWRSLHFCSDWKLRCGWEDKLIVVYQGFLPFKEACAIETYLHMILLLLYSALVPSQSTG